MRSFARLALSCLSTRAVFTARISTGLRRVRVSLLRRVRVSLKKSATLRRLRGDGTAAVPGINRAATGRRAR